MKIMFSVVAGIALLAANPCVWAGAHRGAKVSKLEELPARNGDWSPEEIAKGREQLVRAFDAAWIRVIASRKDQAILDQEPRNRPGAAHHYIVRLADCLPQPELAPWPEKPAGMFKDILETGVIRQLVQGVPETPANTSWYFSGVSQKYQDAVIAEIERHYDVDLEVESVVLPPGRLPATSLLVQNKVDFISQLNATGGNTQGMRRRTSRRFTCTMTASSQYIHIPERSPLLEEIHDLNDLIERPQVRICAGPLTTQTARAYMPEHMVKTKYVNDLTACDRAVKKGELDVIMNPLHDLGIGGIEGYRAVPTGLVAGTPLWVAKEGIVCPDDGDPRTEDECHEIDPP
ncbi:MAG: ABC transporter substrate-binding protein [Gammaproteobacteria bacterium]|nr:MAG: ABC transporter substrate-binding protein [Gammaproteobacteria bacterium]